MNCPKTYYGDASINKCTPCDSKCAECFAAGNNSCTVCKKSSGDVNHFLVYGTTICSDRCPIGYYSNATSFKCLACDANCYECVDDSKKCTSCGLTSYGTIVYL